jgi:hypothetical protein
MILKKIILFTFVLLIGFAPEISASGGLSKEYKRYVKSKSSKKNKKKRTSYQFRFRTMKPNSNKKKKIQFPFAFYLDKSSTNQTNYVIS